MAEHLRAVTLRGPALRQITIFLRRKTQKGFFMEEKMCIRDRPGAEISFEGSGVRCISLNLSISFPERTPQKSVARTNCSVVRFTTNSPDSSIMW